MTARADPDFEEDTKRLIKTLQARNVGSLILVNQWRVLLMASVALIVVVIALRTSTSRVVRQEAAETSVGGPGTGHLEKGKPVRRPPEPLFPVRAVDPLKRARTLDALVKLLKPRPEPKGGALKMWLWVPGELDPAEVDGLTAGVERSGGVITYATIPSDQRDLFEKAAITAESHCRIITGEPDRVVGNLTQPEYDMRVLVVAGDVKLTRTFDRTGIYQWAALATAQNKHLYIAHRAGKNMFPEGAPQLVAMSAFDSNIVIPTGSPDAADFVDFLRDVKRRDQNADSFTPLDPPIQRGNNDATHSD
jgi:hypothetical protein